MLAGTANSQSAGSPPARAHETEKRIRPLTYDYLQATTAPFRPHTPNSLPTNIIR